VRVRLFAHRERIAGEVGAGESAGTPCDFADQIVDALEQSPTRTPRSQFIDDRRLFKAACLAIWSTGAERRVIPTEKRRNLLLPSQQYAISTMNGHNWQRTRVRILADTNIAK